MRQRKVSYGYALITGATSGIGEVFAHKLSSEGVSLLLTGRNREKLEHLQKELGGKSVVADLATRQGIEDLLQAARQEPIDLVIHSAGIGVIGGFSDLEAAVHEATIMTHVMAPMGLTYGLVRGMKDRAQQTGKRGGMIFVASTAGFQPLPYFSTYGAGKAFMLSFAEALHCEFRSKGVDILALCPGAVDTPFWKRHGGGGDRSKSRGLSMLTPQQVVDKAFCALGKKASVIVGKRNYLRVFSLRLAPRGLVLLVAEKIVRRLMKKHL